MHFSLLVNLTHEQVQEHVGDDGDAIADAVAEALAPFQFVGDNTPPEYLDFFETEAERRKEYETSVRIRLPSGELVAPCLALAPPLPWDPALPWDPELSKIPGKEVIPLRQLYPDFETFMEEENSDEERDPQSGKYGYWENPQGKWDWYRDQDMVYIFPFMRDDVTFETFSTFAALDSDGTWIDCRPGTPESEHAYRVEWERRFLAANPGDTYVLVDCHT